MEDTDSAATPPMRRPEVFLSYSSRDRDTVQRIAQRLREAGIEPWFDRWSLTAGEPWQPDISTALQECDACAVFVGPSDLGGWVREEVAVAINRAVGEPGFRVFPVLLAGVEPSFDPNRLPAFLAMRTWVDFRRGIEDGRALQDLVNAVYGVPFGPEALTAVDGDVEPYRGLEAFGEQNADFFFGRDGEVQRLLEKLKQGRFVAVLGASGSGKSSLVLAGLLPALRSGDAGLGADWPILVMRPGATPLKALAARLAALAEDRGMGATLDALERDPRTFDLSVELALADAPTQRRVVLVVDQFEELFTLCGDDREREQFVRLLTHAVVAPGGRAVVVLTLRADFYERCEAYPILAQLVSAQPVLVGQMDADSLRQAIEQPARRAGLELEEGLTETILADVVAEPGGLPLLEHALYELWQRRRGRLLTLEGYRDTGGVSGALAQRAEEVYASLTAEHQQIVRRVLLRLTQPGQGTDDTRRRAARSELGLPGADSGLDHVLQRLVDARLLISGRDDAGDEIVDVAHEALIRGWPRLRGWVDADRAGLLTHRRLTDAARDWQTLGRDAGALYRGARLATASDWAREHAEDLSDLERRFLAAGTAAHDRELDASRRRARRLKLLAGGATALAAVVASLAVWAFHQRDQARIETGKATSLALASAANELRGAHPELALPLAFEAYRASPRPEARGAVLSALLAAREGGIVATLEGHRDWAVSVAFSPTGAMLASGSSDETVRLWDASTHRALGDPIRTGHPVARVAFSRDGNTLAAATGEEVRLWDARTRRPRGRLPIRSGTVDSVAFGPDGRTLAGATAEEVRLWDARTLAPLGTLRPAAPERRHNPLGARGPAAPATIAFSPDRHTIASTGPGEGRQVWLWDLRTRRRIAILQAASPGSVISAVAFSRDGRALAVAGPGGAVRMWDTRTRRPIGPSLARSSDVDDVAFSPDGRTFATADGYVGGAVRLWDARTRRRLKTFVGNVDGIVAVAFSPDSRTLASAGIDGSVRLWDARPADDVAEQPPATIQDARAIAFSPRGHVLAIANGDGARLWDTRTRRELAPLLTRSTELFRLAFSADGRFLATVGFDRRGWLFDMRTHAAFGEPLTVPGPNSPDVALSPDGGMLAMSDPAGVRLMETRSRRVLGRLAAPIAVVAFSPDGRRLATASGNTISLWDPRTRRRVGRPRRGHQADAVHLSFSPDGRTLASTGGNDHTVLLWDGHDGRPLGGPLVGRGYVDGVAFSSDGRSLASADEDGVRLWDVSTHLPLGVLDTGPSGASDVAFSPDGRTLAAVARGRVRIWNDLLWRHDAELAGRVCAIVDGVALADWTRYVSGLDYRNSCDADGR